MEPIIKDYHLRLYPDGMHIVQDFYSTSGHAYFTAGSIKDPPHDNMITYATRFIWHIKPKEVKND